MAEKKLNTELAVQAEAARQERDGEQGGDDVKVKVVSPVSIAGTIHDAGATFTAPEPAVREALARGLVEHAKR